MTSPENFGRRGTQRTPEHIHASNETIYDELRKLNDEVINGHLSRIATIEVQRELEPALDDAIDIDTARQAIIDRLEELGKKRVTFS